MPVASVSASRAFSGSSALCRSGRTSPSAPPKPIAGAILRRANGEEGSSPAPHGPGDDGEGSVEEREQRAEEVSGSALPRGKRIQAVHSCPRSSLQSAHPAGRCNRSKGRAAQRVGRRVTHVLGCLSPSGRRASAEGMRTKEEGMSPPPCRTRASPLAVSASPLPSRSSPLAVSTSPLPSRASPLGMSASPRASRASPHGMRAKPSKSRGSPAPRRFPGNSRRIEAPFPSGP